MSGERFETSVFFVICGAGKYSSRHFFLGSYIPAARTMILLMLTGLLYVNFSGWKRLLTTMLDALSLSEKGYYMIQFCNGWGMRAGTAPANGA